jgi:pimeloyl-ACP methyl ester carboxylesterase
MEAAMLRIPLLFCVVACSACEPSLAQALPRRADTGTSIVPPSPGKPATIARFREGSALAAAGLRVGDAILALDGEKYEDANDWQARLRRLRGGETLGVRAQRGNEVISVAVTLPAMRPETIPGVTVRAGEARTEKGYRIRTFTSRPNGAAGRLPIVVFVPWLSCSPVDNPLDVSDGWSKMLRDVMRAPVQLVRIEKPGVGDSEGPDCSQADLDHDMGAFRAGIRAALSDPGGDPARLYLFGGSVGAALVPILAAEFNPRGILATGGFTRTWLEHMLDIERRRLSFAGKPAAEVNAAMRVFGAFYDRVLNRGATPAQALAENPAWKPHWYDGPAHQYGRPIRYYQQLQALDVEGAWEKVSVPTLIVWGEYDWIMGRDEAERAHAILAARQPSRVSYVVRAKMNHHFETFADPATAFREEGGAYDAGAAAVMVEWLRANGAG